ncbi:MAG TPA: FtsX-like permease family protein, partial [Bacillota bacterium]|nr:FtsX-like permease family protein [Bacillota bacterium]
ELVKTTALAIEKLQGVEKVKYGQGVVEKLFVITRWIRMSGLAIMGLLSLAAVFLISTTIRLTVFARRREISIMKYLGATDWFIRWPFVLEGIMLGLAGALVSVLMLYFGYHSLLQVVTTTLPFVPMQKETSIILNVYELIVALGAVIGALGSLISVRKYLKV